VKEMIFVRIGVLVVLVPLVVIMGVFFHVGSFDSRCL
jgi:hypothetical protein